MSFKKHIIILTAFLLLTAMALMGFLLVSDKTLDKLPFAGTANLNVLEGSEPIQVSYFDKISKRVRTKHYSFTSEAEPVMIKDIEVTPTYTTCDYFAILDEPLAGIGFTENDQNELKKKVIISDTLALELYFNTDAVGKLIEISSEEYIISGVYKTPKSLFDKFSQDGKERIFIPYTLAENPKDLPVHTIVYDTRTASAGVIEQMNTPQYHFTSLSEKAKVMNTLRHLSLLLLYIVFAIVLMYLWYKLSAKYLKEIGDNLKVNYFPKSLKSIPFKYLLFVLIALGIPALILFIFLKADFSIFIVSKYIPYDNLFDIGYYFEQLAINAQLENTLALFGDTYRINLYASGFSSCLWIGAIYLIFLIISSVLIISLLRKSFREN